MIKDILVHVDGTEGGRRRISYAFDLAERHQARLTGLHVNAPIDVPPYYKPSMVERVADAIEAYSHRNAVAAESAFKAAASSCSVADTMWLAVDGSMAHEICKLARCADLVVVGQYEREGTAERHPLSLAEDVAVDCGRPVLVVPAAVERSTMHRALIAWDGGREVVRALHDALPLLRQAKTVVEIATVDTAPGDHDVQSLVDHLGRHQIGVEKDIHLPSVGSTASVLVDRLRQGHFDLLVMGAYGRPIWLEFLFGGTTPSALLNASSPALVSH
jgi:nucleotide-binding universal stress UspA family protein